MTTFVYPGRWPVFGGRSNASLQIGELGRVVTTFGVAAAAVCIWTAAERGDNGVEFLARSIPSTSCFSRGRTGSSALTGRRLGRLFGDGDEAGGGTV